MRTTGRSVLARRFPCHCQTRGKAGTKFGGTGKICGKVADAVPHQTLDYLADALGAEFAFEAPGVAVRLERFAEPMERVGRDLSK
jgi:hypothetical protein